VTSTAISLTNFALVDSGEVDRSAMYSRYNNGPRTLSWGTSANIVESFVYSVSTSKREISAMQI
jgi:hypothetical protein